MTEPSPNFPGDGADLDRLGFLGSLVQEEGLVLMVAFTSKQMHVWAHEGLSREELVGALRQAAGDLERDEVRRIV